MTATSASAQKKGQWLRLDARLFSRQLENNTVKAHSIHAAGMEALLTGISREDVPAEERRLEKDFTQLACHCIAVVPFLMLHSEGITPSVSLCTAFVSCIQYQTLLLANVLLSCAAGCTSCWAWRLCVASGTLVWEELQDTALACGAGAGCPLPTMSPQHLHASSWAGLASAFTSFSHCNVLL